MFRHLHFQISIILAAGTLLVILFAAWNVYNTSYQDQVASVRQATVELMETVAEPATVASYLNQEDMLKDVTTGLEKNSIVSRASLVTTQGIEVSAGPKLEKNPSYTIHMILTSPFAGGKVGELIVVQNKELIQQRAAQTGRTNAGTLVVVALLVVIFVTAFIYSFLTQPIKRLAATLHSIVPGSDKRLDTPQFHSKNELGTLIRDINQLLQRTEQTISSERTLRQKFEFLETRYRTIFEHASAAIFLTDPTGHVMTGNPAFERLRNLSEKPEQLKENICKIFADESMVEEMLRATISKRQAISRDLLLYQENGNELWVHAVFLYSEQSDQSETGIIEGILYDITQRRIQEHQSKLKAERDHLTDLYNRLGVETKLRQVLGRRGGKSGQENITMFLLDLDGFKDVNDTYGHDAGDCILVEIAKRLTSISRSTDTVARWGGDEFVIILYGSYDMETCFNIGQKMLENIIKPIDLGHGNFGSIGASIGVSTLEENMFNKNLLLKSADTAMYQVKKKGKNGVCFYNVKHNTFEYRMFKAKT